MNHKGYEMNFKQNKNKSKKTILLILVVVSALLVGGAGVYALTRPLFLEKDDTSIDKGIQHPPENKVDYDNSTQEQKAAGVDAKEDFIHRHDDSNSEQQTVTVSITSSQQNQGILSIRAVIQAQGAQGSCVVSLEKEGQASITQSADIQEMGSYSMCKGFDISTAELAKGDWKVTISYRSGDYVGSDTKVVSVK